MEQIKIETLAAMVRKMRQTQIEYFATRNKVALKKSKLIEVQVDQILKLIPAPKEDLSNNYSQVNLF